MQISVVVFMGVIRVVKNRNYTTICNESLRNPNLSLKAKGLHAMCISFPDDWKFTINGLAKFCRDGRDGVNSAVKELEKVGYIKREQTRCANGRMGNCDYTIFEQLPCRDSPCTENPYTVIPSTEEPITENPILLSTNKLSKEKLNKDKRKESPRHHYGQYQNVILSDEEFSKLQSEFSHDYEERIEQLSGYMASTGKNYKNHLATIRNWAKRDAQKKSGYRSDMYQYKEGESL